MGRTRLGARGRSSCSVLDPGATICCTLPPSQSSEYVQCHDVGMMRVMDGLMEGLTGTGEDKRVAHQLPHSQCDWKVSDCGARSEWPRLHIGHRGLMHCTRSTRGFRN